MPGFISPHNPLIAGGRFTTVTATVAIAKVTTGFNAGRSIRAVTATLVQSAAPGVKTTTVTAVPGTDGTITFYMWKPTSNSNPTLVAGTDTGVVVNWFALAD